MIANEPAPHSKQLEKRVLVLVAGPRELDVTLQLLSSHGIDGAACRDAADLIERLNEGAAAALVAEEVLKPEASQLLANWLVQQPPWSDFPLILFSVSERAQLRGNYSLANVTYLERPVRTRSMLAAVRTALRSRARQYEARRAIESRDAFLAMLAHELRNPLSAISLAGHLLEQRSPAPSKELGVISRQAAHLKRLVDDLLDVARITHGKVSLARKLLSLHEVARASFDTLQHRAAPHLNAYELDLSGTEAYVEGDRQRLEQVVGNLLTNAIKYTPPGGKVKLSVRSEGREAVVEVSDTGVGIAQNMLARVFEPFAQVDTSLDRSQGGIGLGLALVHSIVQLHGGSVEARSEGSGRGSSFLVRLPLRAQPAEQPRAVESTPQTERPRRLVVVDDNADIRELLTLLLEQAGHQVSTADDGPSGLARILATAPDLALIDLGLPGFDGFELARRARAAGSHATLVALTGYGRAEDTQESLSAGFDNHLVKPVSDAQLRRLLASPDTRE